MGFCISLFLANKQVTVFFLFVVVVVVVVVLFHLKQQFMNQRVAITTFHLIKTVPLFLSSYLNIKIEESKGRYCRQIQRSSITNCHNHTDNIHHAH